MPSVPERVVVLVGVASGLGLGVEAAGGWAAVCVSADTLVGWRSTALAKMWSLHRGSGVRRLGR